MHTMSTLRFSAAAIACTMLSAGAAAQQEAREINPNPTEVLMPEGEAVAYTPLAHVEQRGTGPIPIILIPAMGCDWTVWESFMERNKDRYTCYAITLPGMAGTDSPPRPSSAAGTPWLDNAVEAIKNMIEEEGIEDPIVMGHSFGGQVAVRFACAHQDLVRSAIMLDGMLALPLKAAANRAEPGRRFHIETNWLPGAQRVTREQWDQTIKNMVSGWIQPGKLQDQVYETMKKTSAAAMVQYTQEFYKTDLTDDVLDYDKPLLAVAAISGAYASGGITSLDLKTRWETQLAPAPQEHLTYIENMRHFIPYEAPDQLDKIVQAWAARDGGGGPSMR